MTIRHWQKICVFLISLLLGSCATKKADPLYTDELMKVEETQKSTSDAPDFVSQSLLTGAQSSGINETSAHRFDISVNNMPAKDFFLSLVSEAGVNVVAHPDVAGQISLNLNNVTVKEALDVVRDIYGYEYLQKDSVYIIYPIKIRTEIFTVNYIDIKRVGVADTSVSIGEIESEDNSSSGNKSNNNNAGASNSTTQLPSGDGEGKSSESNSSSAPGSRVQTTSKTDFWKSLTQTISTMIGDKSEGCSVMVNPVSGLLIVTAMPSQLNAVRKFLEAAELSVKRQVVLETQILEVVLKDGFQAGINWTSIQGQLLHTKNVSSYSNFDITGQRTGGVITTPSGVEVIPGEIFSSILKVDDIQDLLSLLETQGSVQVLSSPRVSTVNNQKAIIRVGTDEFFVSGIKNDTTSSAATTTSSPSIELTSFFSGISLDVTPQISAEGDVILHIHPIVSEVSDQIKELEFGDAKFKLPLALRDIRESDSIVRAKNGQVIVLGGLMQKTDKADDGKQPFLGSIPIVNLMFKTKSRASSKTELVILLRPVVVGDDTWKNQMSQFDQFSKELKNTPRPK